MLRARTRGCPTPALRASARPHRPARPRQAARAAQAPSAPIGSRSVARLLPACNQGGGEAKAAWARLDGASWRARRATVHRCGRGLKRPVPGFNAARRSPSWRGRTFASETKRSRSAGRPRRRCLARLAVCRACCVCPGSRGSPPRAALHVGNAALATLCTGDSTCAAQVAHWSSARSMGYRQAARRGAQRARRRVTRTRSTSKWRRGSTRAIRQHGGARATPRGL